MNNYYLKKKVITTLLTTGLLTKVYSMQKFAEEKLELTPIQFLVLGFIVNHDGLYQRQISEFLVKDRPNITRIINILEKNELVKRVSDKSSRKVFKIYATEKGIKTENSMAPTMIGIREDVTEGISKEEIELCMNILVRIQNNLKEKVKMQI